jgi:hypothetical protein
MLNASYENRPSPYGILETEFKMKMVIFRNSVEKSSDKKTVNSLKRTMFVCHCLRPRNAGKWHNFSSQKHLMLLQGKRS